MPKKKTTDTDVDAKPATLPAPPVPALCSPPTPEQLEAHQTLIRDLLQQKEEQERIRLEIERLRQVDETLRQALKKIEADIKSNQNLIDAANKSVVWGFTIEALTAKISKNGACTMDPLGALAAAKAFVAEKPRERTLAIRSDGTSVGILVGTGKVHRELHTLTYPIPSVSTTWTMTRSDYLKLRSDGTWVGAKENGVYVFTTGRKMILDRWITVGMDYDGTGVAFDAGDTDT